jgi:peptidyl-prolyl cis-trans isomerase C
LQSSRNVSHHHRTHWPLRRLSFASLLLAALLPAATLPTPAAAQALVKGQGIEISAADVRAAAQDTPEPRRTTLFGRAVNVQRLAEDLFVYRSLAAQALAQGLDKDPQAAAQLGLMRDRFLAGLTLDRLNQSVTPSAADLTRHANELYRADPDKYASSEQVHARHILIARAGQDNPREKAEDLLRQLKAGASFDDLARAHSADPGSAAKGGDLGWFEPKTMVQEFQDGLAELKEPGQMSGIVESQFGFHIIRLEGRRPAGQRSFDEVRETIEAGILAQRREEAKRDLIRALRQEAKSDPQAIEEVAKGFAAKP